MARLLACRFTGTLTLTVGLLWPTLILAQPRIPPPLENDESVFRSDEERERLEREGRDLLPDNDIYLAYHDEVVARADRLFDTWQARIRQDHGVSPELARFLIDELFTPLGHPRATSRYYIFIIDYIQKAGSHPRLSDEAHRILRDGLMDYYRGTGGRSDSSTILDLAAAVASVAGPDDAEALEAVRTLSAEGLDWAQRLGRFEEFEEYSERLGSFQEDLVELTGSANGVLPPAEVWTELRRELVRLVQRRTNRMSVERTSELALADHGDGRVNDEMTSRLLVAYRLVLSKPQADRRVVEVIDARLLWFAAESGRLRSERHWELWARAVASLRDRASRDLRRFIHDTQKSTTDAVIRRAMLRAEDGWRERSYPTRTGDIAPPGGPTPPPGHAPRSDAPTGAEPANAQTRQEAPTTQPSAPRAP